MMMHLLKHKKLFKVEMERVEQWRTALKEVASLEETRKEETRKEKWLPLRKRRLVHVLGLLGPYHWNVPSLLEGLSDYLVALEMQLKTMSAVTELY